MRILLASPRGFCAGVNMALQSLQLALERFGPPVYVYHEIVHNKWVVDSFRQKGAIFVDSVDTVPEGSHLLYSAHGVPPSVREQARQRSLKVIDATCPLVTKVHREAIQFAQAGYTVVLIGHQGHDEVIGTLGEAPEAMVLIGSADEVDQLEVPDPQKVAYLTQTTLSVDDAAEIIRRLREKFPAIVGPAKADICYATQNRQGAVRALAAEADLALVVGSRNSSNALRLAELARSTGIPAYLIDGPEDLDPAWFQDEWTILITAGASAPEEVVQKCVDWLVDRYQATVDSHIWRTENVHFPLPFELRDAPSEEG